MTNELRNNSLSHRRNRTSSANDLHNAAERWWRIHHQHHPEAAVVPANDVLARREDLARVVPSDAKIRKVGEATVGYSLRRRHHRRTPVWKMNAMQRRRELQAVVQYRRREGLTLGPEIGWALVIGNLVRVLQDHVSAATLQEEAEALGRGRLDAAAVDAAVQEIMGKAWGNRYRLFRADMVGSAIELTSVERAEAGVVKIGAMDDPFHKRRRRAKAEQMRSSRAARAALRPPSRRTIAELLGVSRATLYRMLKRGEIEIAETLSVVTSPSIDDLSTQSVSPGRVHAKCLTRVRDREGHE